jgi:hypothetical protein
MAALPTSVSSPPIRRRSCSICCPCRFPIVRVGLEAALPAHLWRLAEATVPVVCVETRHMKGALSAQLNKTDRHTDCEQSGNRQTEFWTVVRWWSKWPLTPPAVRLNVGVYEVHSTRAGDGYIEITDEDLDAIEVESTRTIHQFVPRDGPLFDRMFCDRARSSIAERRDEARS